MYLFVKRLFDIIASTASIVISLPIWLIVVIGIKLSSPGPIFYKSLRSGVDHKEFVMYKFRSMHVLNDNTNKDPSKDTKEARFIANEKRIFKLGNFLRKSKLDELPQLLNVFCGQMSVVGPRPYPDKAVRKFYTGEYEKVVSVRPGLACLDSLYDYAHGELFINTDKEYIDHVLPVRTELAKMYVDNMSIGLDSYCILRTLQLMFEIVVLKERNFRYTKYEKVAMQSVLKKSSIN